MDARQFRAAPRGFTLIELMMVIVIVAILISLFMVGVSQVTKRMKVTRVLSEVEQLSTALETYKNDRGGYPPTLGSFVGDAGTANQQRVMRHLAKAFPRYVGTYTDMRNQISSSTKAIYNGAGATLPSLLETGNGGLNIDFLDPAESLVFWLGGLPDPGSERKLCGLSTSVTNPFQYSGTSGRSEPRFPFNPARLVDRDGDGWWEYLPNGSTDADLGPPLVYFDFGSYVLAPTYPSGISAATDQQSLIGTYFAQWGFAAPYKTPLPSGALGWKNEKTFQILAAGGDNAWGTPADAVLSAPPDTAGALQVRVYPKGTNYGAGDADNLTNFATGPLGNDLP